MNDHQQATHLLDAATDGLAPDVDRIVAGSVGRGRALRRRARVGTTLAAAAVIGVTGLAASLLPGDGAGHRRDAAAASEPAAHVTPVASTLASLLPHGRVKALADDGGRDYDRGGLRYRGTRVYVYVYRAESCDTAPMFEDAGCYDLNSTDTHPASTAGTWTTGDGSPRRRKSEADFTRPDGWRVSVVATNDRAADGPVVRRMPALSWAELLRIARADVWLENR